MKRVWFATLLTLLPGCLAWPGDIPDVDSEVTNRPPKIMDNLTYPAPDETVVMLNNNCLGFTFSTYVTDPDLDTLYYRLFVNYYLVPTPYAEGQLDPSSLAGNGLGRITIWLSNQENGHLQAARNLDYPMDVVELLISDRPFTTDDYRTTEAAAQVDRYTWTIMLRDLGQCND